jgi:hypothetical protein
MGLAMVAAGVLLVLLGLGYLQAPHLAFAAAAISGIWLGIASLFSP